MNTIVYPFPMPMGHPAPHGQPGPVEFLDLEMDADRLEGEMETVSAWIGNVQVNRVTLESGEIYERIAVGDADVIMWLRLAV